VSDHESWQDEVPAYVASRLDGEARERFEFHLKSCPECAAQVATRAAHAGQALRWDSKRSRASPSSLEAT